MQVRRRSFLVASAALSLVPCAAHAQSSDLIPLRVGAAMDDQSKPVFYALDNGLFAKAGLDVQLVALSGGGAAIAAAVVGGSLDLGKSNALELIAAHVRGLPFTIVGPGAGTGAFDHNGAIVVPVASPIRGARDLIAKTVAVISLVTIQSIAVKAWIDTNGGDAQDVHFLEVPPSATLAALEGGRIDAASLLEPFLSQALAAGTVRVLGYPYGAVAPRFEGASYFTTTDWAAKHADALGRFVRVLHDANVYVGAHEVDTNPLVAKYAKIDPALLTRMSHSERPAYVDRATLQPLIDAAAKYKFIPHSFPAQELINNYALRPGR
jgi:NitT/TauT family transport system substrate-binding protein